jgi:lysophospholipase L1-like esterase
MAGIVFAATIGDSHVCNTGIGNTYDEFWPAVAQRTLNANAPNLRIRNYGISGNTSAQVIGRMQCLFPERQIGGVYAFEVPRFVGIYIGANDPGNASTVQAAPTPTTTVFALGSGKAATMAAYGSWVKVGTQASVQVVGISADTLTVYPALATTPVAGDAVVIDTQKNIEEIGNYCKSRGCSNLVVGLMHYQNYASSGDTVATPLAANVTLRAAQQAAATTLGAQVADFYTAMKSRIQAGTDTQNYTQTLVVTGVSQHAFTVTGGTGVNYAAGKPIVVDGRMVVIDKVIGDLIRLKSPLRFTPATGVQVTANWHPADANAHLNPYGNSILGATFASTIDTAGWSLT